MLAGRDCIGLMPTGAGKSLTFQIPAKLLGGTVLVLSPAHLADEGPGGWARAARFSRGAVQFDARRDRALAAPQTAPPRRAGVAVRCARSPASGLAELHRRLPDPPGRGRRSPLHQPLGPRFPAGVSATARPEGAAWRYPGPGAHGHRDATCRARYCPLAGHAQTGWLQRLVLPAEPAHHRSEKGQRPQHAQRHARGDSQPSQRERHRVLRTRAATSTARASGLRRRESARDRTTRVWTIGRER